MQRREDLQHAGHYRREATVCANAAHAAAEIIDEDSIEPTPPPDVTLDTSPVSKRKHR
jgi:hypothetical protein